GLLAGRRVPDARPPPRGRRAGGPPGLWAARRRLPSGAQRRGSPHRRGPPAGGDLLRPVQRRAPRGIGAGPDGGPPAARPRRGAVPRALRAPGREGLRGLLELRGPEPGRVGAGPRGCRAGGGGGDARLAAGRPPPAHDGATGRQAMTTEALDFTI